MKELQNLYKWEQKDKINKAVNPVLNTKKLLAKLYWILMSVMNKISKKFVKYFPIRSIEIDWFIVLWLFKYWLKLLLNISDSNLLLF